MTQQRQRGQTGPPAAGQWGARPPPSTYRAGRLLLASGAVDTPDLRLRAGVRQAFEVGPSEGGVTVQDPPHLRAQPRPCRDPQAEQLPRGPVQNHLTREDTGGRRPEPRSAETDAEMDGVPENSARLALTPPPRRLAGTGPHRGRRRETQPQAGPQAEACGGGGPYRFLGTEGVHTRMMGGASSAW